MIIISPTKYTNIDGIPFYLLESQEGVNRPPWNEGWYRVPEEFENQLNDGFCNYELADVLDSEGEPTGEKYIASVTPEDVPVKLNNAKRAKRNEISRATETDIVNGVDVELSDGTTGHFSMKTEDQINIKSWRDECANGLAAAPYHADGEKCKMFSAEDIVRIYKTMAAKKMYATTYCNKVYDWIDSCESVEEVEAIVYGAELPANLLAELNEIVSAMTATMSV